MVSDLECQITVFAIIIALLARLSGFEILMNDFTHIFSLCDQIVAKKLAFARLRPIERSTTPFCHRESRMGLCPSSLESCCCKRTQHMEDNPPTSCRKR